MIVVVSPFLLRKKFNGMALWPFVILKEDRLREDKVFLNHERIHLRQQLELLIFFFYLWYLLEFLFRWVQYRNRYCAYRNISLEREAYENEKALDYVENRSWWSFLKHL
ncbi:MAG: hypothetical protein AAFP76_05980 [Bacteroidota bacterium]